MPSPQLALDLDGLDLRDQALDLLERTRATWIHVARGAAHQAIERFGEVSADDIHRIRPVPEGIDPRVMGAVLNRRRFRFIRYQPSRRPECHARPIAVWGAKS